MRVAPLPPQPYKRFALFHCEIWEGRGQVCDEMFFCVSKRYKSGDLPCVLATDFLRRGGKDVKQPFFIAVFFLCLLSERLCRRSGFLLLLYIEEGFL